MERKEKEIKLSKEAGIKATPEEVIEIRKKAASVEPYDDMWPEIV
jgi:hypothetical protein